MTDHSSTAVIGSFRSTTTTVYCNQSKNTHLGFVDYNAPPCHAYRHTRKFYVVLEACPPLSNGYSFDTVSVLSSATAIVPQIMFIITVL